MPDELPKLYLVRHGNTDWSQAHRFTGRTDLPLNARGEERARKLAQRLYGRSFVRVFSSPLQRARRTCELAGFGEGAETDGDLVEWDYGDYEGASSFAVHHDRPQWNLFRDGAPKGESPAAVARRADRFIAKVRRIDGDVIAFSSGHIIRVIGARWVGLEPMAAGLLLCSTASINILSYEHSVANPAIELWNDEGSG